MLSFSESKCKDSIFFSHGEKKCTIPVVLHALGEVLKVGSHIVELEGVGDIVGAYLFAAQGAEK